MEALIVSGKRKKFGSEKCLDDLLPANDCKWMQYRYSKRNSPFQIFRATSARSEASKSPYAKNYRTNLTHDQREILSHRQNVSKLQRRDLEDRYIALMDEHFTLKKENAVNHEKIKKLATKLLRLSADGKSRGAAFPQQLSPNENLEIQFVFVRCVISFGGVERK